MRIFWCDSYEDILVGLYEDILVGSLEDILVYVTNMRIFWWAHMSGWLI